MTALPRGGANELKVLMIPCDHEYVSNLKRNLEGAGVRVVLLKPFHYATPLNILKMAWYRARGYRIIHVHWLYIFPFLWVVRAFCGYCRRLGIRVIWEMHNIVAHGGTEKDKRMSRIIYSLCDGIIYHSEADVKRSEEIIGVRRKVKSVVVYHANFIDEYKNEISKEKARESLGIPKDKSVLLCFGQIRSNRGYEYLLRAFKGIEGALLVIAGEVIDGGTYRMIQDMAGENVKLVPRRIPADSVQVFFNAADVVVLPYTEITTSGVVPLAYSFAKPVIVSALGGMKEIVNDEIGILVPPRDKDALRQAIATILGIDHAAMGRRAYAFAAKNLTWLRTVEEVTTLYHMLDGGESFPLS